MLEPIVDTIIELPLKFELKKGQILNKPKAAITIYGNPDATTQNTILFGHGFSCSSKMHIWWQNFIENIDSKKYKLICINTLGSVHGTTGPSSPNASNTKPEEFPETTIEDQANFYRETLSAMGIERVGQVIGASMGGMHALQLYLNYPKIMSKCIVIGATPLPTLTKLYNLFQLRMLNDPRLSEISKTIRLEYCRILLRLNCLAHETVGDSDSDTIFKEIVSESEKYSQIFTSESHELLTLALNDFKLSIGHASKDHANVPLQFISIENDYYIPEKQVERFHNLFNQNGYPVTLNRFLTKNGHEAWITDGDNFAQFMKRFI